MNRIVSIQDINFLGLPMKGRLGTVVKTEIRNKKVVHHIRWDGIDGNIELMTLEYFKKKTKPVMG